MTLWKRLRQWLGFPVVCRQCRLTEDEAANLGCGCYFGELARKRILSESRKEEQ